MRDITTGKECLEKLATRMKRDNRMAPTHDIQEVRLGGINFFRQDWTGLSPSGSPLLETVFSTLKQNHALEFVLTGPSDQAIAIMVEALEKANFF